MLNVIHNIASTSLIFFYCSVSLNVLTEMNEIDDDFLFDDDERKHKKMRDEQEVFKADNLRENFS